MSAKIEPALLPLSAVRLTGESETPAGQALAEVLAQLGDRMALHRRRVLASSDPDALHDLRVAARRSRSALSDVRRVVTGDERRRLRTYLAELGRSTGPLRDLDVLIESLSMADVAAIGGSIEGREALLEALRARASTSRLRVAEFLSRADLARDIDRQRGLRETSREWSGRSVQEPISAVAERSTERARRRFIDAGERASAEGADDLIHRTRICGKRLRYLLEFFGGVLDPQCVDRPTVEGLKSFQRLLGAHNDIAVQLSLLGQLREEIEGESAREFLSAWLGVRRREWEGSRAIVLASWSPVGGEVLS